MYVATTKLVDKIMISKYKQEEESGINVTKDGRHKFGLSLGVPAARKVYEDQIVRELQVDEESPQIAILRSQIRDQVMADIENGSKKSAPVESVVASVGLENFSNVQRSSEFPGANK